MNILRLFLQLFLQLFQSVSSKIDNAYEDKITSARINLKDGILSNLSVDHANVVIRNLFELAVGNGWDVLIVSGYINPLCYENLVDYVGRIKSAGGTITIILTEPGKLDPENNKFFTELEANFENNIYVSKSTPTPNHFIVVGDSAFRYEHNHDDATASLSFNNTNYPKKLRKIFNDIEKSSWK